MVVLASVTAHGRMRRIARDRVRIVAAIAIVGFICAAVTSQTRTAWIIGGITTGVTYALVALGLVLIYRATDTFNFAHGYFMVFAAFFLGQWEAETHVNFVLLLLAALALVGALGAVSYQVILRRLVGRPLFVPIIATLGLATIAEGAIELIFGPDQYNITVPGIPTGTVSVFGDQFGIESFVVAGFGLAVIAIVILGVRFTSFGKRMRATGQDALLASQVGINVHLVNVAAWVIGAGLAGLAGISYGISNSVDASMTNLVFLALPAMMLGGLDSIPGAVLGGLIIGILQSYIAADVGGSYVNVITYSLLIVTMLVIPEGLLGTRVVRRL